MTDRYEVHKLRGGNLVLKYKYGYTRIECNETTGKTIVINDTGDKHIEYQFDEVFGLGEYKKFMKNIINHSKEKNTNNPHCIKHTIVGNYIPKQAKKDMQTEKQGNSQQDLIDKFFTKKR